MNKTHDELNALRGEVKKSLQPHLPARFASAFGLVRQHADEQLALRVAAVAAGKPDPLPQMLEAMKEKALAD